MVRVVVNAGARAGWRIFKLESTISILEVMQEWHERRRGEIICRVVYIF